MSAKKTLQELLAKAGITLNGDATYDIKVRNDDFYQRVLRQPILGLGETYMDGWWECDSIDEMMTRILLAGLREQVRASFTLQWQILKARLFNLQRTRQATTSGQFHYDKGNDLFEAMLDSRMTYSSAYWPEARDLDAAQEAKLDLVCRKLELEPGMTVLDLGCGYGSFAGYAAEHYGVQVRGVTVSKQQHAWYQAHGNPELPVDIRRQDYRQVEGNYDRVVSIGFFEHVGVKNYPVYMKVVQRTLKSDGISLLHTIGGNISRVTTNPWLNKYIFPNGMLPSIAQIGDVLEGRFVMEDWHNFGPDYDRTLMEWNRNVEAAWPELQGRYSDRFHRMWRYYLLTSAAGFRARHTQLWQLVLTHPGREQPYVRYR